MTGTKGLQRIDDDERLTFDELLRDVGNFQFDMAYPPGGRFFRRFDGNREYWYYTGSSLDLNSLNGVIPRRYVGPCNDPEIEAQLARKRGQALDTSHLRYLAESLRQRGWTSASKIEGRVLGALSTAGAFRLRSVLIGSVAYQTYSGLLGFRLPCASLRTDDVDIAVDFGISHSIDDACGDIPGALRMVDPSFAPKPHFDDRMMTAAIKSSSGYQVEFLTTHRGSDEQTGRISRLPTLGPHMGGVPLRYLDFLIRHPVRSLIIHDIGVVVTVPAPERFAIHKMIVAGSRQEGNPKIAKDLAQAAELIQAHALTARLEALYAAWDEAWGRGQAWRDKLKTTLCRLDESCRAILPIVN